MRAVEAELGLRMDFLGRGLGSSAMVARGQGHDEEPGEGADLRAFGERLRRFRKCKTCVLSGPPKGKKVGR